MEYLLDTNTVIDAQANRLPIESIDFIKPILNDDFNISFITYIEFLAFKKVNMELKEFISLANTIQINEFIIEETIQIRRNTNIKVPDCIIAATAKVLNLKLITRNISEFNKVTDLQIINLYDL